MEFGTLVPIIGAATGLGVGAWQYALLVARRTQRAEESAAQAIEAADALAEPAGGDYLRSSAIDLWEERYSDPRQLLLDPSLIRYIQSEEVARRYREAATILADPEEMGD